MKILQVITSLQTGGAEKLITDIVPRLREKGNQVDVLVFDGAESPFRKRLEDCGIKAYNFGINCNVYNPLFIFRLVPFIRKYDIIHTHNTACQYFVAIAKSISFSKVKLVTTEHNTSNRRRNIWWFKSLDKWMYKRYSAIIAISNKAAELLTQYIGKKNNISTVLNGIDVAAFMDAKPVSVDSERAIVTMVAGFRDQKDQDTLIRAMALLPESYELWLVGGGYRREICEGLAAQLNLNERVKFLGIREDVSRILKASDIIVMSSHYEGLSLSNIEGMAAGKPFIASDVDGLHEATEGAGILFPHGNAEALAKEIEHLMADKDYYNEVAQKCMKRAEEYDISKMVDGYERIYESIAGK
jgi:glycosyltransferase involved in cell wall biosynthesis